jgi:hypothetical protein
MSLALGGLLRPPGSAFLDQSLFPRPEGRALASIVVLVGGEKHPAVDSPLRHPWLLLYPLAKSLFRIHRKVPGQAA